MNDSPKQISLSEWDSRYSAFISSGMREPVYGGPLSRHACEGDLRLPHLKYDNSQAALNLWNFLLTEEDRLREARDQGYRIVGTMKDLGTIPVMAYSLPNMTAFYPDGAWWIPCVMELNAGLLDVAASLGIDDSFCPVRAMLGAFVTQAHFPLPDLLTCSVGATCDDFSAIAQRLNSLGFPILWWEVPHRRRPEKGETPIHLPGGFEAPKEMVLFVRTEMERIRTALEDLSGERLNEERLRTGIREANRIRANLRELRRLVFTADVCPLPALELLIAEMLAIHFCSDRSETLRVLKGLLNEVKTRIETGVGFFGADAARILWVNPVADLQVMNLLEARGGRLCGTDYMFAHAIDEIPEDLPPMEAFARMALADPMVGSTLDRAERICADIQLFGAEAVLVSRIPGASHCAQEGALIADTVKSRLGIPVAEIEVPPVSDSLQPTLCTRIDALLETVKGRR